MIIAVNVVLFYSSVEIFPYCFIVGDYISAGGRSAGHCSMDVVDINGGSTSSDLFD